ncbi:tartrate-resistant acid phosphatase type 5 [Lingula anatina]|uniref:Tartrate-resistant acid phosphatase type 5 n=1 Tax=Lingula anatina TaxID=7574 RepID=A0A1S3H1J2_LINAN|nr:tartrate-resistant acid phosphatase type 5 [Lingula anatina]XP_013379882.1 tartrate-resistant acid phosphatase type 5 [Lingula anatina]XP_013379883.1 tartrate-resistant acid phosphatase type 5 [Lingula anatina]XP_013379884.1 tartrate-resistant acid phosphatase type 5 [Lingula anatina]XP_013379885.1 tartrate-resistant acid phosphatase type 5 [Lingula anatina]|eukprot:XP_013379880.1 tartrate-resistant acid phosphatase type 5 [Lingula anatina]
MLAVYKACILINTQYQLHTHSATLEEKIMAIAGVLLALCCMISVGWASGSSLRFLAVGDWGGLPSKPYTTHIETSVAHAMGQTAAKYQTKFTLALGDNFYYDGVKHVDDARFHETFENVYTDKALQTPWYIVAGNHDHRGNVDAEIEYSKKSHRWNFPHYYYPLQFSIPGSQATVSILMLDTIQLCGNTKHDLAGDQPQGPADIKVANAQWDWLEENLKNNKASYIIVAGHYPVISIAEHGPTKCLTQKLMPMLYKYKVTAFFSGHDHNLQHLQHTQSGVPVDYFVIGSGNFVVTSTAHHSAVPSGSLKYHGADKHNGGFAYIEATPQAMTLSFISGSGAHLYSHSMKPRK